MSEPVRVAVIGAGHMGKHHARTLSRITGCKLVAVVDRELHRAEEVAGEFGGRPCADVASVIGEIDAATVAVPTVLHDEVAIPLMERGIAVLVEKPLAPDVAAARRLLDASRKYRCVLQVGHSERFNPIVRALLKMNVVPRFIETHRVSPFTFRSADVGVVFDMMIHDIDIVLHLVRRREYTVDAVGVNVLGPHEDVANARVRFAGGAVVNMTASRLALKTERRIRVFCSTAYISMDYHKKTGIAIKLADNIDLIRMARERNFDDLSQMQHLDFGSLLHIEPLPVETTDALEAELTAFLDAVRTGAGPAVSAEDGFHAVELAERITSAVRAHDWGERLDA
jgi:predicted dehydrogenase